MTETPPTDASNQELGQQLERTAADLRVLGEQLGAVPPGGSKVYSVQRARLTFAIVVAFAALVGWFAWSHWHSLLVALAPLVWIFGRGWRMQRRRRQIDPGTTVPSDEASDARSSELLDVLKRPPGGG